MIHSFNFYNASGKFIRKFEVISSDYVSEINLPKLSNNLKYYSFSHHVLLDEINVNIKNQIFQHRGYTIFKNRGDRLGSIFHGNLGGIACGTNQTAARKRNFLYFYTPVYKFKKQHTYHLVFNNPTNKKINITIKKNAFKNSRKFDSEDSKYIASFGNAYFEIKGFEGSVTCISKLPVCRPFIIKNPNSINLDFDVCHS